MEERGVKIDHATINRWVVKYAPILESEFRLVKKPVLKSWRMDETYIKVKGQWVYYYRAVDKENQTVDFFYLPAEILQQLRHSLKRQLIIMAILRK